jgi:hypothetical protein
VAAGLDAAGQPYAGGRVTGQLTEDRQGMPAPLVDLVLGLGQVRTPHCSGGQRGGTGEFLGDHLHLRAGLGEHDGGGESLFEAGQEAADVGVALPSAEIGDELPQQGGAAR